MVNNRKIENSKKSFRDVVRKETVSVYLYCDEDLRLISGESSIEKPI